VPVGDDQKQHLELTRDIAQKFNSDYKRDFFPEVEPLIFGTGTRVMSLRDGNSKMSKSDPSDNSRINLTDNREVIAKKIKKAKTDSGDIPSEIAGLEGRPELKNLMNIFAALDDRTVDEICAQYGGQGFAGFKNDLAELSVEVLGPIAEDMKRLCVDDRAYLDSILREGAEKAHVISHPIICELHEIVGFLRP
jgi:tryptophanyl-tRNA synthetase